MSIKFENIKSCFLGLATGDALGVPVEFRDRSYFKDHPVKDMLGYGTGISHQVHGPTIVLLPSVLQNPL